MNRTSNRFVLLPSYINLTKEGLHYKDLLIYIAIRSHANSFTNLCIPSFYTIAEKSGTSKKYVSQSIKRLEKAGYLYIDRSAKLKVSNKYTFKQAEAFARIPYDLFELHDLNANQKAMLIALRQCFDSSSLEMMYDLKTTCLLLDLTYRTIYPMYSALIKTGYIEKFTKQYKSGRKKTVIRLTDKINWRYELINPVSELQHAGTLQNLELLIG
jgi:DNA-binding MarR family transcriptional regulator